MLAFSLYPIRSLLPDMYASRGSRPISQTLLEVGSLLISLWCLDGASHLNLSPPNEHKPYPHPNQEQQCHDGSHSRHPLDREPHVVCVYPLERSLLI